MCLFFGEAILYKNADVIEILEKNNYKQYVFEGCTYIKTGKQAPEGYYIYVRPDIPIKEKYIQEDYK